MNHVRTDPQCVFSTKREFIGFGADQPSEVSYLQSNQISLPVRIKLKGLDGVDPEMGVDAHAECGLYSQARLLCAPAVTPHSTSCSGQQQGQAEWTPWLYFPIFYRDLPIDTLVGVTVYSPMLPEPSILGGTTFYMFTSRGRLKRGPRRYLLNNQEADGSVNSTTLGKVHCDDYFTHLNKEVQEYAIRPSLHIPWLDKLTLTEINKLNRKHTEQCRLQFLNVEFHDFTHTVIFTLQSPETRPPIEHPDPTDTKNLTVIVDPELKLENPAESKNIKMAKFYHLVVDTDLQPNAAQRKYIYSIIAKPPLHPLDTEEKLLLWQFRYFLSKERKGFVKFMRCVDWNSKRESKEALKLKDKWDVIGTDDALELLSAQFQGAATVQLRQFAVETLKRLSPDDLLPILLQLVQALRYEKKMADSALARFLIDHATKSFELANQLHWYLSTEKEDAQCGGEFSKVHVKLMSSLDLGRSGAENFARKLEKQGDLMKALNTVYEEAGPRKESRDKKVAKLKSILRDGPHFTSLFVHEGDAEAIPVTLPLDPNVQLTGVVADNAHIYGSSLQPMAITFITAPPHQNVRTIFKNGDDLRQDQLVIQLFNLMDSLLKKNGLDLKLTPYRVLATSTKSGLVECVPECHPMGSKDIKRSVQQFLRKNNPTERQWADALENYIKSCAGYCVITFLLGIGDRHLDNIMIRNDGRIFHIDFGFILGRDPKPFPPAMKITKEMVTGMGGDQSNEYLEFKSLSCSAYNILRKHASLILNLLALMIDANIPGISGEGRYRMDPRLNIQKVQDKFRLDLNDTDAVQYMQSVIRDSVASAAGPWIDFFHELAS